MKTFIALSCVAMGCVALAAPVQQPVRDGVVVQPTGSAGVSGRVMTTDTPGQPVRHARVTLVLSVQTASRLNAYSCTTDDEGRFVIPSLPAGRFDLAASKASFITIAYGAVRPGRPGTPIAIADGQHLADITVKLQRGSVITGRLSDRSGQPAPDVTVNILRVDVSKQDGDRSLVLAARAVSDDRGEYRAFGLAAGDYIVVAMPATPNEMPTRVVQPGAMERALLALQQPGADLGSLNLPAPAAGGSKMAYSPVFYPGTTDGMGAATIALGAGEERGGTDLTIAMVPTARVHGAVTVPPGIAAGSVRVTLASSFQQASLTRGDDLGGVYSSSVDGGTYAFASVPAGTYTVFARAGGPIATPGARRMAAPEASEAGNYWALAEVVADGRDLDVPLTLQPGLMIAGHVVFDGAGAPPTDISSWRVTLDAMSRGVAMSLPAAKIGDAGRFTFFGATPGTYRPAVSAASGAAGWFLASATTRGRETLDTGLEVVPGAAIDDLTLTFTNQPASIDGHLISASGRVASDYFLIVFPADRSFWTAASRRVRETRPASDGAYAIAGLPPCDYRIAALTDVEPGEWNDPRFLESLIGSSVTVTLDKGRTVTRDLQLK